MFDIEFINVRRPTRVFDNPVEGMAVYDALVRCDNPADRYDTPGGLVVFARGSQVIAVYHTELGWAWEA